MVSTLWWVQFWGLIPSICTSKKNKATNESIYLSQKKGDCTPKYNFRSSYYQVLLHRMWKIKCKHKNIGFKNQNFDHEFTDAESQKLSRSANLPLRTTSVFLIVHHSTRFRVDLLMPSEVNVGLLTVCNFCHNVSKTHRPTYPKHLKRLSSNNIIATGD